MGSIPAESAIFFTYRNPCKKQPHTLANMICPRLWFFFLLWSFFLQKMGLLTLFRVAFASLRHFVAPSSMCRIPLLVDSRRKCHFFTYRNPCKKQPHTSANMICPVCGFSFCFGHFFTKNGIAHFVSGCLENYFFCGRASFRYFCGVIPE